VEFTGAIRGAQKGTAEIVVLAFLEDQPRHGYELAQLVEERSSGA
jgi:DNA-binding PadR family transcriptional regulator